MVALPLRRPGGPLTLRLGKKASVSTTVDRLAGAREVFPNASVMVSGSSLVDEGLLAGREVPGRVTVQPRSVAQSDGAIRAAQLGLQVPAEPEHLVASTDQLDNVIARDLTTMVQPAAEQGAAAAGWCSRCSTTDTRKRRFTSEFTSATRTAPPRDRLTSGCALQAGSTWSVGGYTTGMPELPEVNRPHPDRHPGRWPEDRRRR